MGTTYDALFANNAVSVQTTAVIEGFPYILTDREPSLALTAYDGSATASLSDFANSGIAVGGLSVHWDMHQRCSPWKPFTDPSMVKISLVPALDSDGAMSDAVGVAVFKRTGGTETHITVAADCNDTAVTCQRVDDFAASGYLYAGAERLHFSSKDTGTDTFTMDARGSCSVFGVNGGGSFAHTHKPASASEFSIQPKIGTEPRTWVGRWIAIWIHARTGTTSIDVPDHNQAGAHLAFAGRIVSVEDVDGATVFTAEDVRRKILESSILRDPFRARVKEGVRLSVGSAFSVGTERQVGGGATTVLNGTNLTVVSGAPANSNEVQAGTYTVDALGEVLNEWLSGEKLAARILFNLRYEAMYQDASGGIRGRLVYNDPTSTAGLRREVTIGATSIGHLQFLGWSSGGIAAEGNSRDGDVVSDSVPLRAWLWVQNTLANSRMDLDSPRGTWAAQTDLLPQALRDPANLINGVLHVKGVGYLRAGRISDTQFYFSPTGMDGFFTGNAAAFQANAGGAFAVTVEDDVSLDVEQVLILHSTFKNLLLQILLSTGTSTFNDSTYDILSEPLGCAIPYSILGADFVAEVAALDCAEMPLTAIVRKTTRFGELFEADFILRRIFFTWGLGRLRIGKWATPASNFSSYTLTETSKCAPSGTVEAQRSQSSEDDDFYNIVHVKFNSDADGNLADELTLIDASSVRDHGERPFTINARNTVRQVGDVATPIDELVSLFAGYFTYTSRPWQVIKRSIDFNRFEATYPGTLLSLTDKYIRDPATGLRYSHNTATGGLSGVPGMVISHRFDWGGAEAGHDGARPVTRPPAGDVEIMLSPGRTMTTYVPCAQVDDTQANAGYNAGSKVLTCYAHEHTESSESADATFFVATDKVLVIEMDPATAASAQSWSDTVASQTGNTITLTTGLAGWDSSKKYRVIYDSYSTCTTAQKAKTFQADDAGGLVADTVQAYGFSYYPGIQGVTSIAAVLATETPSRHATNAYGDGKAYDVGYERDAARLANNLIGYRRSRQQPTMYSEVRNFNAGAPGSVTWQLIEMQPIYVGIGELGHRTRLLTVAPRMRSTDGSTAEVRVRLCRLRPTGTTMYDVSFLDPYQSATFTATSTTFAVSTAQTLNISHLKLSDALNGGWGWLTVEVKTKTELTGLAKCVLGEPSA
jgi:hypothetical protein